MPRPRRGGVSPASTKVNQLAEAREADPDRGVSWRYGLGKGEFRFHPYPCNKAQAVRTVQHSYQTSAAKGNSLSSARASRHVG